MGRRSRPLRWCGPLGEAHEVSRRRGRLLCVSHECEEKQGYGTLYPHVPRVKMWSEKKRAPKFMTRHTLSAASRPKEGPRIWGARDLGNILVCWLGGALRVAEGDEILCSIRSGLIVFNTSMAPYSLWLGWASRDVPKSGEGGDTTV
jgi:hypothetical protein